MSDSLYTLVGKLRYDKSTASIIDKRIGNAKSVSLLGLSDERVIYEETAEVREALSFLDKNIGKLDNDRLADSVVLESLGSSTIEGARTTLESIKSNRHSPKTKSDKMVCNVLDCIDLFREITDSNIRGVWCKLTKGVCENQSADGVKYRSGMVYIGSESDVVHVPARPDVIDVLMQGLFQFSAGNSDIVSAIIVHWYVAYIHPFCDGNGRLARLWQYYKVGLKGLPVSGSISATVQDYYRVLKHSDFSYRGVLDITCFIEYILRCMCNSLRKALVSSELSEFEYGLFNKINRDGAIAGKFVNKDCPESVVETALESLVKKGYLFKVKEDKRYRYFRDFE